MKIKKLIYIWSVIKGFPKFTNRCFFAKLTNAKNH